MRSLLLVMALAFLLPLSADAQRRYRITRDDDDARGTDLQVYTQGLSPDGVGLRFWLGPQTALTTRLDFSYTDFDRPDGSVFSLGATVGAESHLGRSGRVHPFFALDGRVGVLSFSNDFRDDANTYTVFGGDAGLGAEARLMDGLTLNARYELSVDVATGNEVFAYDAAGNGAEPVGGQPKLNVRLGGVPRLALSFRF